MNYKKILLVLIVYSICAALLPWLPGIDARIGAISLRLHSAGNVTAGILWICVILYGAYRPFRARAESCLDFLDTADQRILRNIVWIIVCIIFVTSVSYKLKAHASFQTHALDLGIYATNCWNTLNGRIMWNSLLGQNYLGHHLNVTVIPLSLAFLLWKNAGVLLIVQSAVISLAFPAVYRIVHALKFRISYCFALSLIFMSHPMIIKLLDFDFQNEVFIILFYCWAIAFWLQRKNILMFIMIALALLVKEDITLTLAGWGFVMLITGRDRLWYGLSLITAGVVYFIVSVKLIIPYFYPGEGISNLYRYSAMGSTWGEIIMTVMRHPVNLFLFYMKHMSMVPLLNLLSGFAFVCILNPLYLIPVVLGLLPHVISSTQGQYNLSEIYVAASIPFLFLASLKGLQVLQKKYHTKLFNRILTGVIMFLLAFNFTRSARFYKHVPRARMRAAKKMILLIEPYASVLAQSDLLPHVVCRDRIQSFPQWDSTFEYLHNPDYIMVDTRGNSSPFTYKQWEAEYHAMRESGTHVLVYDEQGYQLWKNKYTFKENL
ncbi:MAG: DUF2079 domain-containing protein [bacterium]